MAERLTDKQVTDLLDLLRSNAALDHKVNAVTNAKSAIKQHNVPETCIAQLFEALRTASTAQHAVLVNAGFTALGHLLTRLSRQEPKHIGKEAVRTLPVVIEKLGDQKDKYRTLASQALVTIYAVNPGEVERMVRTTAMSGKNPRAKEAALHWLLQMHQDHGLQFRGYVPLLMELLEDADGMVRDAAKHTVIELFRNAPNTAKSDLKRQLKNFKVRPAIEQAIIKELAPSGGRSETPSAPAPAPATRPHLAASVSSMSSERPITPAVPESQADPVEPQYVNTNRELDEVFKGMAWQYEGRETEQNWQKREQGMTTLRRLNAGNAPSDFHDTFLTNLRGILDGIIKSLTSLRTSLSKEACALIEDVALTLGPAMEPMVELLMQTLLKMTASTKKITSQMTSSTIDTIINRISYTPRIMQHIWNACQDKNVQPRLYTAGWLRTLIKKTSGNRHHIEHTGGVDLIEKCLKKGLADANPGVREKMRPTYWAFWAVWPARADAIMEDLDATAQKLLNKDPSNPNSPKKTEAPRPGSSLSRTGKSASRPNIREAMLAQKRAMAAQKLPPRPGSAMAQLSPARTSSNLSANNPHPTHAAAPPRPAARPRPESTISVNAGGMSVAPMRPSRRRPEVARPATAGPYSIRDQPGLDVSSPESLKSRHQTPRVVKDSTPKKPISRTRPGHVSHDSESSIPSPTSRAGAKQRVVSPRISFGKPKMPDEDILGSSPAHHGPGKPSPVQYSPTKAHEDTSLVVPSMPSLDSASTIVVDNDDLVNADVPVSPTPVVAHLARHAEPQQHAESLKVYEDPDAELQSTPKPEVSVPVLEDKPVNEDAAKLQKAAELTSTPMESESPEKMRQNSRLLDSGIAKIKAMSLEVHGFRKLQSLIRDSRTMFTDDKFEALLLGLFKYLENPLTNLPSDKGQDIKAQILATVKLLLKKERENFQPHVSKGLEALLQTRSAYDSRAHVVSGLELLADELVGIGDGSEIVVVLTRQLQDITDATTEGCRSLSMGVRMDAVKFCVALHARVGEAKFWDALSGIQDDPKSLITYYIVKRQREQQA
ncbi:hypothetical protein LLEC1_07217 [Akanthomyces lecanii]|uniref:TOG domain-containing protein n=1 Tax=Cordyceps confragosa TaxID=2714763 RepID=A0A179IBY1_CORDF|nr:hypothetical protein LLEC1_07217 [Akanthomyces lecanii]